MSKICIETIDLGFSLYIITHNVYQVTIPSDKDHQLTQTIGFGVHDLGVLPKTRTIRIYNYPYDKFPSEITRDANNPVPQFIDQFLIFENTVDI